MIETISVLRLTVPTIPADAEALKTDPAKISAWIDSLPLANVEEAATSMLEALERMNRSPIDTQVRYQIMEQMRAKALDVDKAMKKQREKTAYQPSARNRELAALHGRLLEEIAHAYKRVLVDLLSQGDPSRVPQAMIVTAHRVIEALTHELLEAYVAYSPEPDHIWGEVHRIYRFASQAKIHKTPVPSGGLGSTEKETIDHVYRQLILLYLANPYHLMQGEIYTLFNEIDHWIDGCKLTPIPSGQEIAGALYIDPDRDEPPMYAPTRRPAKPLNGVSIDVSAASALVDAPIQTLEEKRRANKKGLSLIDRMRRDMLLRLKHAWEARRERASERVRIYEPVEVLVGLGCAHHFVSGEEEFVPEQKELRSTGGASGPSLDLMNENQAQWATNAGSQLGTRSSVFGAADLGGADVWDTVYETRSDTIERTKSYDEQFRQKFHTTTWQQFDKSEGGISLSLGDTPQERIRVGEIIGYRDSGDDPWTIGSVRWMQFLQGRGLSIGVRNLTKRPFALGGRAVEGTGEGGEYFRLLLTTPISEPENSSLIAPAAIYDVGTRLLAVVGDEVRYLRLTRLEETTRSFSRFGWEPAEKPKVKTPLTPPSTLKPF
ncbi:MAG: hypothetical protein R3298_07985 [Gammaproteobacteria bacterium]|nr:hypothetical protein [Gammaproteobacteria bacterium]